MSSIILFEDEHLLVVHKPCGINTHKPDSFALDGIHEWLKKQETRWQNLSILHRLDKETSGVMVFGKTRIANQSLARQFESRAVEKEYLLLVSKRPSSDRVRAQSHDAVTDFEFLRSQGGAFLVRARPLTGKTHQVRIHAAENGFAILGDEQYGGGKAPRLMLHAHAIAFEHPESGKRLKFDVPMPESFAQMSPYIVAREFRDLLFSEQTNTYRLISGIADGFPDVVVDSYGDCLLVQWQTESTLPELLEQLQAQYSPWMIFEQTVTRQRRTQASVRVSGEKRPPQGGERFLVREHGVKYWVNFVEGGLSTGIFLDQRENRRRLMRMNLAGKTVLNCFAYTCSFTVAAARAGATVTSVDLSKRYLEWGKTNLLANDIEPAAHDFIYGDVFEWLKRFGKRGQRWDVVLLDPPTFSTTKKGRVFRVDRDYQQLNKLAMPLVAREGTLFCSTNQRTLSAENFEQTIRTAAADCGRVIQSLEFETLPFDFRVPPRERPYLKTFWARLD